MTTLERLGTALADRYRIERELGAGGMATVYLAADIKHDRKVAIKVLRPELAAVLGAERFVQEIKTTAALSHPHILPLFDSGEADGFLYYVMPYIQGETIREKLNRETQFGIDEAVKIATEVADALDYAHRNGVIHRDIKPENVLLHDGRPMVMDFGIALAVSAAAGGRMTETGLSLGTPHYMSPEQATADRDITGRSDIYSLASVLYEMLTGEPPHMGTSAQQIIMKIIAEPVKPATELRKSVPPNVAAALAQALEKLPADRFESARSFAEALTNRAFTAAAAAGGPAGPTATRPAVAALTAVTVLTAALAAWGWLRPGPPPDRVLRYADWALAASVPTLFRAVAISPDGTQLAYTSGGGPNFLTGPDTPHFMLRSRNALAASPVVGVGAGFAPFFSPDGREVAFCEWTPGQRSCAWRVVAVAGGTATALAAESSVVVAGGTWGDDGIYLSGRAGLSHIARVGDSLRAFTAVDTARGEAAHLSPSALPGGRGVLFVIGYVGRGASERQLAVADPSGAYALLGIRAVYATYVASGHLVYVTAQGTLMAIQFDLDRRAIHGEPHAVAENIAVSAIGAVNVAVSRNGTLLYLMGTAVLRPDEVAWVERDGAERGGDPWVADFGDLALSPDGSRLVVGIRDTGRVELWVRQGERGALSKLTFAADGSSEEPAWTPDGESVAFVAPHGDHVAVYVRRADGSAPAELLFPWDRDIRDVSFTADGATLLLVAPGAAGDDDIFALRLGGDSVPVALVATRFGETDPAASPDGRWLAYTGNESGRNEVYVRPLHDPMASRRQVSSRGARRPGWSHSGRELFYLRAGEDASGRSVGEMVAVPVMAGATFAVGDEHVLFSHPGGIDYWGVTPDGRSFVVVRRAPPSERNDLTVVFVEHWLDELKTYWNR